MAEGRPPETHAGGTGGGLWVAEGVPGLQEGRTHPLYKKLSGINGEVNAMSRGQLKQRLRELRMEPRSVIIVSGKPVSASIMSSAIVPKTRLSDFYCSTVCAGEQTVSSASASRATCVEKLSCRSQTHRGISIAPSSSTHMAWIICWCWTLRRRASMSTHRISFTRS